jgi:hypothetical protein
MRRTAGRFLPYQTPLAVQKTGGVSLPPLFLPRHHPGKDDSTPGIEQQESGHAHAGKMWNPAEYGCYGGKEKGLRVALEQKPGIGPKPPQKQAVPEKTSGS